MIQSTDVMRMLDNCARMKITALILDTQLCLNRKLRAMLPHWRGPPDDRVRARGLIEDLERMETATDEYYQALLHHFMKYSFNRCCCRWCGRSARSCRSICGCMTLALTTWHRT